MSDVPSPKASRQSRPKWLDPKLFLGILLVLGSMALGGRIIGEADSTTSIYIAKEDIQPGAPVTEESFEPAQVRFTSKDDANRYIATSEDIPKNTRSLRMVEKGEFVPRDAISSAPEKDLRQFSVPIRRDLIPKGLAVGDRVDVYFVPDDDSDPSPYLSLRNIMVLDVPEKSEIGQEASATLQFAEGDVATGDGKPFDPVRFNAAAATMQPVLTKHYSGDKK